ncbi:unnamed protein product [Paramecium octaurelia]|uniref:Uncharacterized protein n=1 Tax=Paramecium octaurelia TaxID=43137 RepID=A0A8S1UD56_PAROT|nr:unnamed protein product [Paramecium octaurelia]
MIEESYIRNLLLRNIEILEYLNFQISGQKEVRQKCVRTSVPLSYTVETWYGPYLIILQLNLRPFGAQLQEYLNLLTWKYHKNLLYMLKSVNQINHTNRSTQLLLEKKVNLLSFKIYMKCVKTKTIVSQFLKCQSCSTSNQNYSFLHYCHGQIDPVTYFPKFQLIESSYKELNINFLVDRITITQTLFNQIQSIETLIEIKFKV